MKKILSIVLVAILAVSLLGGSALAATNYVNDHKTPTENLTTTFQKYLIVPDGVEVPAVSFAFTIAAGEAQNYDVEGDPPSEMAIYAGVQPGDVTISSTASFSSADTASLTTVTTGLIDITRKASVRATGATAETGVELAEAGEKFVAKTVTVDFSRVVFPEPGIYRYIVSETPNTATAARGIVFDNDTDRVLDVYVTDDGSGQLLVSSYVMHTDVNSVNMGAQMGSDTVHTPGEAAPDKTDGFTNEFKPSDLTFKKLVTGNQASRDKVFDFTLLVGGMVEGEKLVVSIADDSNEFTLDGNADATSTSNAATIAANANQTNVTSLTIGSDGTVTQHFYLQHNQYIVVRGLPLNATYSVTENKEDYKSDVTSTDPSSGVMSADRVVEYTNTRNGVIPTGIMLSIIPGAVIVGAAGVGFALSRKSKKEDDED